MDSETRIRRGDLDVELQTKKLAVLITSVILAEFLERDR
jgi:hypothetical protein